MRDEYIMKKMFLVIIVLLLSIHIAYAQSEGFSWNIFKGIFGKTEEAQEVTEEQIGEMIGVAEEFGTAENIFTISPRCVHYYITPMNLVAVEYGKASLKTDLTPTTLEIMLRQLEYNITEDLGNVQPTYREALIC